MSIVLPEVCRRPRSFALALVAASGSVVDVTGAGRDAPANRQYRHAHDTGGDIHRAVGPLTTDPATRERPLQGQSPHVINPQHGYANPTTAASCC